METGKVEGEWVSGSAADFLGLTKEEEAIVKARLEHACLKDAVVEKAKAWNATPDDLVSRRESTAFDEASTRLGDAVDALIAFEAEHKIGE